MIKIIKQINKLNECLSGGIPPSKLTKNLLDLMRHEEDIYAPLSKMMLVVENDTEKWDVINSGVFDDYKASVTSRLLLWSLVDLERTADFPKDTKILFHAQALKRLLLGVAEEHDAAIERVNENWYNRIKEFCEIYGA